MKRLLAYLRALAVMRAHVVAPDPTVPVEDADRHSRKIYVYRTRFLRANPRERLDLSVVATSCAAAAEIVATAREFR